MIAVDTDVLAIYHIFHRDLRYQTTHEFIDATRKQVKGIPLFSLLELCGLLASANRISELQSVFDKYLSAQDVIILFPPLMSEEGKDFWAVLVSESLSRIKRSMRFGDASLLWIMESSGITSFITWNTRHFIGKTRIQILTPAQYLSGGS